MAYYANDKIKTISSSKWNSSLGTPIGVVVIPSNFLPDGKARIVSLKAVDDSGNASTEYSEMQGIPIGISFDNFKIHTNVPITNNTGSISSSSNSYGYLPSDNFTGEISFVDSSAKYNTISNFIPSPYNGNEFNIDYNKEISGNNALGDLSGYFNTEALNLRLNFYDDDKVAVTAAYNYMDGVVNEQWYLPSVGELGFLVARLKTINSTISMLGGVEVQTGSFWSSTMCTNGLYYVNFSDGSVEGSRGWSLCAVRPFAMIG